MSTKMEETKCFECGKIFLRESRYIKISIKKKRNIFCGLSCVGKNMNKNDNSTKNVSNNKFKPQCQKGYTRAGKKFCWFIARANSRKNNNGLTEEILNALWEKQNGRCAISNIELELPNKSKSKLYQASLDRIDSSKPYQEDNIQFVAMPLNLAKNNFQQNEFVDFLMEVSKSMCRQ